MRPPPRKLPAAFRWACTVALLLTILAWTANLFCWVNFSINREVSISCATGAIHYGASGDLFMLFVPDGLSAGWRRDWMGPTGLFYRPRDMMWWVGEEDWGMGRKEAWIPLWMPALAFAIPAAILWRTHLKHRRSPNSCPTCNYDRSGIPAATPCPECGTAAG